jgi:glycosyltransferase involved in cell wall biosynthesis
LQEAVFKLLHFVGDYPHVEEFQKIVARLLHEMHDERALPAWLGISLRFPRSMDSFHNLVVAAHRYSGVDAVRTIVAARFPRRPNRIDHLLAYAEACDLAGDAAEKQAAFESLSQMFGRRRESWMIAAAWLEEEVGASRAFTMLIRRLAGQAMASPLVPHIALPTSGQPNLAAKGGNQQATSVRVLGALFERILETREGKVTARVEGSGGLCLLTGSLGAGGAERQLVNSAVGFHAMQREGRRLSSGVLLDPVRVIARSLRDRKDGSFFLGELQEAGVPVSSYRELPDFAGDLAASGVRPALTALGFLPWSTAEAVIKLTDWLRASQPEVVHIWQDGLVYAAGLAALLSGVPRIVLSGRSTPPPDRRARYPIEYDIIYKSLLRAPGVRLSVNSHHAARRYAEWLGIDGRTISVVPNGVQRPDPRGDDHAEFLFRAFAARTPSTGLTLGAVMRLDEVKRPLLWIDAAAALHDRRPGTRFIVVGDGPFRARAERRAELLGILDRCLFVGRSNRVGYWLSKMDALMLLSEHEGLPNALIEAQMMGVPVITSPAGGAAEAIVPGRTGLVTARDATPRDIAEMITGLVAQPGLLRGMGRAAQRWAVPAFNVESMLANTLEAYDLAGRDLPAWSGTATATAHARPRFYYMED